MLVTSPALPPVDIGGAMSTSQPASGPRELAHRSGDGLDVVLLWHPHEDAVTVHVHDARCGDQLEIVVEADRALEAFHHPFAYAAREIGSAGSAACADCTSP
jgi:hypothetical protein